MIRVLQYIGSMEQRGSQAMIMNIYRNIDREQVQFDFVIHAHGITSLAEEAISLGANIFECPRYNKKNVVSYSKWWKNFLKEHKEDYPIIHSHVRSTAALVLGYAKKIGYVTIAHSHNTSSGSGITALIKSIFQYRIRFIADYFFGCSQEAGEWLFGKKVCSSDKYFNVKNAIDSKSYVYSSDIADQRRKEFNYTSENIVIGHVGGFVDQKNHSFLIDVFKELYKMNKNYRLLLVGDGRLRSEIEEKVRNYGLENVVNFTGIRNDVNELMMAMDVFVFPSKYEGLGIVVIEAQATACPCIVSDNIPKTVGLSNLVNFVSLKESAIQWAQKVLKIPKEKRKNMQKLIIDAGYDIKTSVAWIQDFYLEKSMDKKV